MLSINPTRNRAYLLKEKFYGVLSESASPDDFEILLGYATCWPTENHFEANTTKKNGCGPIN